MSEPHDEFGMSLYLELKRLGRGSLITDRMKYAEVQTLKAADRAGTYALFKGSAYELLQHVKQDSPSELAAFLVKKAEEAERNAQAHFPIVLFGAFI